MVVIRGKKGDGIDMYHLGRTELLGDYRGVGRVGVAGVSLWEL